VAENLVIFCDSSRCLVVGHLIQLSSTIQYQSTLSGLLLPLFQDLGMSLERAFMSVHLLVKLPQLMIVAAAYDRAILHVKAYESSSTRLHLHKQLASCIRTGV